MNILEFVKQAIDKKSSSSKLSAIFKELSMTGTQVSPQGPGKTTTMPKVPTLKAPAGPKAPAAPKPKGSSIPDSMDPTDLRPGGLGGGGSPMSFGQSLTS